jgi:hypothetical protein
MPQDSSLAGLRRDHVALVGRYWMRFSLRTGGGLMTILVVLTVGLGIAAIFATPVEQLMASAPGVGHTPGEAASTVDRIARSPEVAGAVEWVTGARAEEVSYLLQRQPALLSAIFLSFLVAMPWIFCFGAFNQTSGDIANRGLRYLLLRTERPNIYLGRFLGTLAFLAVSLAVLLAVVVLYIGLKFDIYPAADLLTWSLQGYVAFLALALPYVAMCAWVSGGIDSPFGSLVLCLLLVGFPVMFLKLANMTIGGDAPWLERLIPWGWKYDLLAGDVGTRLLAYAVMLGFTAFFLFIGLRLFRRRDL